MEIPQPSESLTEIFPTLAQNQASDPDPTPVQGLECPGCGCRHFYTAKTTRRNGWIQRYKTCRHCGRGVHTREQLIGHM